MRTTICSLVILSLIIQMTNAAIGSSSKFRPRTNLKCESPKCPKEDDGLDLTETIKKLGVEKARELSEVSDLGNITSYSGFFTINNKQNQKYRAPFIPIQKTVFLNNSLIPAKMII